MPNPHTDPYEYSDWLNQRVRAELKRLRLELNLSAYELAIPHKLTAQTIRNIENGTHSPKLTILAMHCMSLGTTAKAVFDAAAADG